MDFFFKCTGGYKWHSTKKLMENCTTHNIFKKTFKIFVAETSLTLTITVFVSHCY